jgi:single-strand DNA-binding protein
MNAMRNKVQLIGYVGATPMIRETQNGKRLARLSLATNEEYKNAQGEQVRETTWHNVVAWDKLSAIVEQYVNKGSQIIVEGKIVNRTYADKDGVQRWATEIEARSILLLDKPNPAKDQQVPDVEAGATAFLQA